MAATRTSRGLVAVLALVAIVCALTAAQRLGAVSLASLAASPRQIAEGRLWLLLSSGAIASNPVVWSIASFVALALLALVVCGSRILWFALVTGQTCSTLLAYSIIGAWRLVDPGALQRLDSAPDYGVSTICAAWLGAVATVGWRRRRESARRATIVLGCVAVAALAWFLNGGGLNLLDTEHGFAFVIGIAAASGRVPLSGAGRRSGRVKGRTATARC